MANGHSSRNYAANSQQIVASTTQQVISEEFPITAGDSLNIAFYIAFAEIVETNAIALFLEQWTGHGWRRLDTTNHTIAVVSDTAADSDVTSATDQVTLTGHAFETGDAVYYKSSAGNVITGLTDDTIYYVIDAGANAIQLATTYANALAGTAIDLTQPSGSDTHRFTKAEYTLNINKDIDGHASSLPLWPKARWTADSGTSDTATLSGIWVTRRL